MPTGRHATVNVAIVGAPGYGGIELLRLLLGHPEARVAYVSGQRTIGRKVSDVYPQMRGACDLVIEESDLDKACETADVLCFALEHGVGTELVAQAVNRGKKVIDFSADFRLSSRAVYEAFYGEHGAPELIGRAVYGLPELHREEIEGADFVAVPGCHATAAILPLAPVVDKGWADLGSLVIDSKTGISGVGRSKLSEINHFPEAAENVVPYSIPDHRHRPEIEQELGRLAGEDIRVTFVPTRVPLVRGILSTGYAHPSPACPGPPSREAELQRAFESFYADEPFVRVVPPPELPCTKAVAGSNYADVAVRYDAHAECIIGLAAVDNLTKGLASAAVQCMNLMCGFEESDGLHAVGVWP
jgi:N-acetyl-gamma-glutamyl-phosphate reductase